MTSHDGEGWGRRRAVGGSPHPSWTPTVSYTNLMPQQVIVWGGGLAPSAGPVIHVDREWRRRVGGGGVGRGGSISKSPESVWRGRGREGLVCRLTAVTAAGRPSCSRCDAKKAGRWWVG